MSLKQLLLLFLILSICTVSAQKVKKPVASFNGGSVNIDEFTDRYNNSPQVPDPTFAPDSGKLQFFASLIAEKLWAREAEERGLSADSSFTGYIDILRKMFIRDAVFKEFVDKPTKVSDAEKKKAELKSKTTVSVIILFSTDSVVISRYYDLVKNDSPYFDTLVLNTKQGAKNVYKISFADLENESVEDAVFALKEGQITKPLKDKNGWYLFKALKIEKVKEQPTDPLKTYRYKLRERKLKATGEKFLGRLLKDINIKFDEKGTDRLVAILQPLYEKMRATVKKDTLITINEAEAGYIMRNLTPEEKKQTVILFPESPVTMSDVFGWIAFNGFGVQAYEVSLMKQKVIKMLRKITEEELLCREGLKMLPGAAQTAENELVVWKENALATLLRNRILDSTTVTEQELREFYTQGVLQEEQKAKVSVLSFYVGSADSAALLLQKLKDEKSVQEQAIVVSKGKYALTQLMPYSYFAPFADNLKHSGKGDIIGPLKAEAGFYIFKVTEKKEDDSVFTLPFERVRNEINLIVRQNKAEKRLNEFTLEAAKKYSVQAQNNILKTVKGNTIPMVVYRFIGFGGKIVSSPFVSPMYKWYKEYQQQTKLNP